MLLSKVFKRTDLISKIALRGMAIKPKNDLSAAFQKSKLEAEEAVRQKRISQTKHPNDINEAVFTQKELDKFRDTYTYTEGTYAEEVRDFKPGAPERTEFYTRISQVEEADHPVVGKVKNQIKKLLDDELEFLGFCEEINDADKNKLIEDTYKEIEQRKSFFFQYDNSKVNKNKKIYDVKAPGNTYRKIPHILPHEHIHPQHYIDVKTLTADDITQLYAYYSLYIDFHIGQIRREVDDKSYIPQQFNQLSLTDSTHANATIDNKFIEYYHHWREPTRTWRSQTQEIDHDAEKAALPINHHPDPKAFTMNEVEWSEDKKFPHVANRMGYPILAESPLERITGFERAPAHPSYQFQAFVQTPSMEPDPTLNFEMAETVYENKRIEEWIRMWKWILGGTLPFWPAFYTFEIYQGDGVPSLKWLADAGNWHRVPMQMQDSGNWNLNSVRYVDEHNYMNIQYIYKRTMLRPAHTMYQLAIIYFIYHMNFDYVNKMVYNKDKDLVFVYKPFGFFAIKEYIYEVHHLESMVPGPVGAYKHLGMGHKDGITTLRCMDTKDVLKLYNDPKYWNLDLRDDFISQTRTMWPDLCTKYEGRVVYTAPSTNEKQSMQVDIIERELDEAVNKHGKPTVYPGYAAQFYDDIKEKRKQISGSVPV